MDSLETIIEDPNSIDFYNIPLLWNNKIKPPLLEDRTTSQRNYALIIVVALEIFYYVQSECSNIIQRVNT